MSNGYQKILDHHNSPEGQAEYKANRAKSARISEQIEAALTPKDEPQGPLKLSRDLRNELVRAAGAYMRQYQDVGVIEISDHVFSIMLDAEDDRYGTDPYDAVEISDYAYGIATFITGGKRDW